MPDIARYLDPLTVEQLAHLRPAARRGVVDGLSGGPHRGRFQGTTAEFRQHRPYVPGDEPRRLDWRVLARTDRPVVRQHDTHTNLRCLLVLDASGSMAYGDKSLAAARVVAALAHLLLSAGESVGVSVAAPGGTWLSPRTGSVQLARVVDVLDRTRPAGAVDWPSAAAASVARLGRRAVVVVVSDLLAPVVTVRAALSHFRRARHDVTCLRLLHPDEQQFPFRGRLRLRGLEGERPVAVDPAVARPAYLANVGRHRRDLTAACRSLAVGLHEASTADPVATTVARVLRG